jgi:hypothetical protein
MIRSCLLFVPILIPVTAGCGGKAVPTVIPPTRTGARNTALEPGADLTNVEPAVQLTAEEFFKEYAAGWEAMTRKYEGKVIELRGEVERTFRNGPTDAFVALKVEKQIIGVRCKTVDRQPWATVAPGQTIKIKGVLPKELWVVAALVDCVFVDVGPYAAIPVTTEELAKEHAADPAATKKKYHHKHLVVSGAVASKEFNNNGSAVLGLKTDSPVKVTCIFDLDMNEEGKAVKVGQQIKLVGEFLSNSGTEDEVLLTSCLPITGP